MRPTGTLIGRLLPRMMLRQQGVPVHAMAFGATAAGKPYIVSAAAVPRTHTRTR